jgi:hypothetical protein
VQIFRCYALNDKDSIVAAENIEAESLDGAIDAGWQFVAAQNASWPKILHGLEIWQGARLQFTTAPRPTSLAAGGASSLQLLG